MNDLSSIFSAKPKSTFDLLSQPGLAYYVPVYQRPYSWGKNHVERLLDDVIRGVATLADRRSRAITFLGTFILIHDTKYRNVTPNLKGELPNRVMVVIDGQQRLTTLILVNLVLHDQLGVRIGRLSKSSAQNDFGLQWIRQVAIQTRANLQLTFEQDMNLGDADFRYYPRLIRAIDDSWSRNKATAKYDSPIASLIHQYGLFSRKSGDSEKLDRFVPKAEAAGQRAKVLLECWKLIVKVLTNVAAGKDDMMPSPANIGLESQESIFQEPLPSDVEAITTAVCARGTIAVGQELLRLTLFARYLLSRVAVTEVVTSDDDYAFDIFEALNSTGDPLTSFDTFKPRIVHAEGEAAFERAPSFAAVSTIESYLNAFKKPDDKHNATSRLIIPFALAESGVAMTKRLSDQRRYLQDEFESLPDIEAKRAMVARLANAATFLSRVWPEDSGTRRENKQPETFFGGQAGLAEFCLDVLRSAKHTVTIAPLLRFYEATLLGDTPAATEENGLAFAQAIAAFTAFFALWRGSRSGTDNIDRSVRAVMSRGLAARPGGKRGDSDVLSVVPSAQWLQQELRAELRGPGAIPSRSTWLGRVAAQEMDPVVAKLLLFGAGSTSAGDILREPGLPGTDVSGPPCWLSSSNWRRMEVCRIAPVGAGTGQASQPDHGAPVDGTLGNLALTVAANDRPRLTAAERIPTVLDDDEGWGISAVEGGGHLAQDAPTPDYLGADSSIAESDETALERGGVQEQVRKRTLHLAALAWQVFAPWLGVADEQV